MNAMFSLILLLLIPLNGFTQSLTPTRLSHILYQDVKHFAQMTAGLFTRPLAWQAREWQAVGKTVLITSMVSAGDDVFRSLALRHRSSSLDFIFAIDKYHGSTTTGVIGMSVYTTGLLLGKPDLRRTGLYAMEAFFLSGTINLLFKIIIGRQRPYAATTQYQFKPFTNTTEYRSMPSGHTVTAFAVSTVFANQWDNPWWKSFWYGSAFLVAGARVYHNAHWVSDTIPAAVLGYAVGKFITSHPRSPQQPPSRFHWSLLPAGNQIQFTLRF